MTVTVIISHVFMTTDLIDLDFRNLKLKCNLMINKIQVISDFCALMIFITLNAQTKVLSNVRQIPLER